MIKFLTVTGSWCTGKVLKSISSQHICVAQIWALLPTFEFDKVLLTEKGQGYNLWQILATDSDRIMVHWQSQHICVAQIWALLPTFEFDKVLLTEKGQGYNLWQILAMATLELDNCQTTVKSPD